MSRVDEAMRRAAGESRGAASGAAVSPPAADQDTEALAHEPFPVEMPEWRSETPERRSQPADGPRRVPQLIAGAARADEPPQEAPAQEGPTHRFDRNVLEKLVVDPRMPAGSREQYRRLAAVLHDAQAVSGIKVVMIASAVAGEGKSLTAANLALTLAGSYRKRVLLIDADLRRPTMHQVFSIDSAFGLGDGLDAAGEAKLVVRQISPTLAVLPAGRPTHDPLAALISDRMRRLIEEARDTFEWVIIDTPPLVLLPDANLLASMVDGAVLVIKAAATSHEFTRRAVEAIGKARILGVVLNRAEVTPGGYYHGYYGYYGKTGSGYYGKTQAPSTEG